MASAAAEVEKRSSIVVGLLVAGNIIILVRHPQLGSQVGGQGKGAALSLGLGAEGPGLPSRLVLWAPTSEQPGFESQLCLFLAV